MSTPLNMSDGSQQLSLCKNKTEEYSDCWKQYHSRDYAKAFASSLISTDEDITPKDTREACDNTEDTANVEVTANTEYTTSLNVVPSVQETAYAGAEETANELEANI
ncbi:hypothetical protein M7I_8006 [Glarea lozoyensis 74030]|uniref:Uncharacterized protein n=1 Tax=Glarea lozoyensis (strain ATCC 74030 / MF5533) TaxID=1104152 RepID=H0EYU6_GLAL7|nr:hypothetical protein M7I_8006 [Glarea lozoyensis 74030]